jgi:hypothetical protein
MDDRSRRRALVAIALFAVALAPRLYVAFAWTREPVWDGHYYDIGARSIAAGRGYVGTEGGAWCHYPVGYSGWLGLAYRLFGTGVWVGPCLNAFTGALSAVFVRELALRAVESRSDHRANVAGFLVALHPGLIAYTPLLMTELTSAFVLVAAPLVLAWRPASRWNRIAAGVIFGLGTLVRPQTILCAPAALLLLEPAARTRARLAAASLVTAVALVVVAPWTARNCSVMDGCAFVSTNGGWNLAIGSFPRATGRFETLRGSDGCTVVTGQVQQDRCWSQRAVEWIGSDPVRWLSLIPKKLGFTFDHESFAVGYLGEADPTAWPEARKESARQLLSTVHRLLMLAASLAFVSRPSRRRPAAMLGSVGVGLVGWFAATTDEHPFWLLAIVVLALGALRFREFGRVRGLAYAAWAVGTLVFVHAVFFGEDRYHVVVTPLFCLLAAFSWRDDARERSHSGALGEAEKAPDGVEQPGLLRLGGNDGVAAV